MEGYENHFKRLEGMVEERAKVYEILNRIYCAAADRRKELEEATKKIEPTFQGQALQQEFRWWRLSRLDNAFGSFRHLLQFLILSEFNKFLNEPDKIDTIDV